VRALLAALLVAAAAGGCATVERALPAAFRPAAREAPAASPLGQELVAYLARLRGMNERGLAVEAARQREMARAAPSDLAQLKIAIALSLSPQVEEGDILALVEPVARREGADDDLRAMASFLHVQALERRRLRESAATANTRLRDERRAVEAQKQRADALQERAVALQQKIDALTEIEKSLSDRQAQGR
jgi:hypothetical protein